MRIVVYGIITFGVLTFTSCAGPKNAQIIAQLEKSNCNHQVYSSYTINELPKPIHTLEIDTVLTDRFSFQSLNAANAIGLLEQLTSFVKLKKAYQANPSIELRIEIVEVLQRIYQRINIASLEVAAIASEMDCEEERADQIATYLKGKDNNIETKLTVAAIVTGASGAVASGLLTKHNTGSYVGVATGLLEATFGALILFNKHKISFYHHRNALKEIWTAPQISTIFPSSVWYYLTYQNPITNEHSPRQQLVDKWLGFGQIADVKEKNREKIYNLFFGQGGKYTADQLTNRANMHDQIESQINLMKQDLKLLALELEKINK